MKLNKELAREILARVAAGESLQSIANAMGLKYRNVWDVARGRTWRDVRVFGMA